MPKTRFPWTTHCFLWMKEKQRFSPKRCFVRNDSPLIQSVEVTKWQLWSLENKKFLGNKLFDWKLVGNLGFPQNYVENGNFDAKSRKSLLILTMTLPLQERGKKEGFLKTLSKKTKRMWKVQENSIFSLFFSFFDIFFKILDFLMEFCSGFWGYWCDGVAIAKGGVGGSAASPHEHFIYLTQRVCSFFFEFWHFHLCFNSSISTFFFEIEKLCWKIDFWVQKSRFFVQKNQNFGWKYKFLTVYMKIWCGNKTCHSSDTIFQQWRKIGLGKTKIQGLLSFFSVDWFDLWWKLNQTWRWRGWKSGYVTKIEKPIPFFKRKSWCWENDDFWVVIDRAKHAMRPTFGIGLGSSFAAVIGGGGDRGGRRSRSLLFLKKRILSRNNVFKERKLVAQKFALEVSIMLLNGCLVIFGSLKMLFVCLFFLFFAFAFVFVLIDWKNLKKTKQKLTVGQKSNTFSGKKPKFFMIRQVFTLKIEVFVSKLG